MIGRVRGRYLVDVVSAASVDIVSTASRHWQETRHAGSLEGSRKIGEFKVGANGSVSREPDYLAWTAGGTVGLDFAEKNVTTLFGYTFGHDTAGRGSTAVRRLLPHHHTPQLGRRRDGRRQSVDPGRVGRRRHHRERGLIQTLSVYPDVLAQSCWGHPGWGRYRHGQQTAPTRARPRATPAESATASPLTGRLAHRFSASTIRLEERIYWDTWGIAASSTELRYIIDLGRRVSLWPRARFHVQTPVTFWERAYIANYSPTGSWNVPALRTGDRELGPLRALTGGLGIHFNIGPTEDPTAWILGVRGDAIWTKFLDDLYVSDRLSGFGALTLEATFE